MTEKAFTLFLIPKNFNPSSNLSHVLFSSIAIFLMKVQTYWFPQISITYDAFLKITIKCPISIYNDHITNIHLDL